MDRDPDNRRLLLCTLSAGCGGLVVGYNIAVISGALLFIRRDFGLSGLEQGALVSVLPLGAMAGGLLAGRVADAFGRRRTLLVDGVVLLLATALTVAAQSYGVLLVGRAIIGVGLGMASSTVPLYVSEIAPPDRRGRLVTVNQLMLTGGILLALVVDLALAGSGSWRAMFGVGLIPSALLVGGMLRAPESPAWLSARSGRGAAGDGGGQVTARELVGPSVRPALVVGVTLAAIQQFSGINAVISYAPSILEKTGLGASDSILYSVSIGVINVLATIVSLRLVDRSGRRPLLLASLGAMSVSLVLLGLTFVVDLGGAASALSLICLVAYVAAFAIGIGPVFWLLIAEIFPPGARAAGASVSTAANWFWNFCVGLLFLPVSEAIGQGQTFWIFAAVCAFGLVFVGRYVPETKGRGFAEIGAEVRDRWQRRHARMRPA